MKKIKFSLFGIFILLALGTTSLGRAAVVYSNLGAASPQYDGHIGHLIGSYLGSNYASAMPFTPSANYQLTLIEVALGHISGANSSYGMSLRSDSLGLPGAIVESWSVSAAETFGNCCSLTSVVPSISVSAGVTYWLVVGPEGGHGAWPYNNQSITGSYAYSFDGGVNWAPNSWDWGAFRVSGDVASTAVPEPATVAQCTLGFALLAVVAKRRQRRI